MKKIFIKIKNRLSRMFCKKAFETMTLSELALFEKQLKTCSNYLEFGAGSSTIKAIKTDTIKNIVSVESDSKFWHKLQTESSEINLAIDNNRLFPHIINVGEVRAWGYPIGTELKENWSEYSQSPFTQHQIAYDLILVDGRFRISCILNACLNASADTKIVIHDFFNRPQYFVVLPFLNLIERADTMGLFSVKQTSDRALIEEYISIYKEYPE